MTLTDSLVAGSDLSVHLNGVGDQGPKTDLHHPKTNHNHDSNAVLINTAKLPLYDRRKEALVPQVIRQVSVDRGSNQIESCHVKFFHLSSKWDAPVHPSILRQFGYEDLLLQFCAVNSGPKADLILPSLKPALLVAHTYESFANELAQERHQLVTLDAKPTDPFPPRCFTYVTDFLYAHNVTPPDPAFLLGCSCVGAESACGTPNHGCSCAERVTQDGLDHTPTARRARPGPKSRTRGRKRSEAAGGMSVAHAGHYDADRRLVAAKRGDRRTVGVAECSAKCLCPPQCTNRVVQHGVQVRMVVRYDPNKGWAAFADQDVSAGTFIAQYLGEVVTVNEAHARTETYNRLGYSTYLYDMDFWAGEMEDMGLPGIKFAIDAQFKGNVARFFNHSCDANLLAAAVLYDAAEPHHHRLAFFARRDIQRGEELCFDYQGGREETDDGSSPTFEHLRFECHCGSANCRKVIF